MNLRTVELKAFVPARDLPRSAAFYRALGFEIPWISDDLAYVRFESVSFLLQNFYVKEHAENTMLHLLVESADDWYQRVLDSNVVEQFGARVAAPEDRSWGLRDFPLTDPTGVLWRIGHNLAR